ncbi:hypothetical protein DPMN_086824 [Dreissena polymorpha]|uniref:Uncharacterized protein n=1 Tax=Dreissena polymorpha TaxID=45954 RepID=A0A9D4KR48_DREPO|nr:hypothetical protein DPMN_086824 [Dreissena polymorpha]
MSGQDDDPHSAGEPDNSLKSQLAPRQLLETKSTRPSFLDNSPQSKEKWDW